jgi:hypothetical protein
MKLIKQLLFTSTLLLSCASTTQQKIFRSSEGVIKAELPRTILFVNIDTITTRYIDNTTILPEIEHNDSFYCSAANNLLMYECSKLFTVKSVLYPSDSTRIPGWTSFADTAGNLEITQNAIKKLAHKFDVGYLLIPYNCTLQHSAVRRNGWRDSKYNGAYEQPVTYTAASRLHVQIWNRDGKLVFEKIGVGSTGRPILYDVAKKRRKETGDIVSRAKKLFSPPLLRALNEAAHNAMILH